MRLCQIVQVLVLAVRARVFLHFAFHFSLLLHLLSFALLKVVLLVALMLLLHCLFAGVGSLLENLHLLILSLFLGRNNHGVRSFELLVGLLSCDLGVDGLRGFPLYTLVHVIKRLKLTAQLDLDQLLGHLFNELFPAHLVLLHLEGDVGDD